MIIQIRGTSGSGKTWAMRKLVDQFAPWLPHYVEGRKKPIYSMHKNVYLLGHYESNCGCCDNIGSAKAVYDLICSFYTTDKIVLCEGLLLSEDVKWSSLLADLRVIYLTTPLEQCLAQIRARRASVGNNKPLNEKKTTHRVDGVKRSHTRLLAKGITCRSCTAEEAVETANVWVRYAIK